MEPAAVDVSGQIFEANGSDRGYAPSDVTARRMVFYNETNGVGASVESTLKRKNFTADFPGKCSIWDREDDTKYYRYLTESTFNVANGNIIDTEMTVTYEA